MLEHFPDVLTVPQCAAALQISKNNVYMLVKSGALAHKKVGKLIRIPKIYIIEFLDADTHASGRDPP